MSPKSTLATLAALALAPLPSSLAAPHNGTRATGTQLSLTAQLQLADLAIRAELGPYAMTPFPQGSVHAQYNPDCSPAVFVAAFADEDPGAGHVADGDVGRLRAAIPDSIALGVRECLDRCGIHQEEKRGAV